jgi:hypothetical protein
LTAEELEQAQAAQAQIEVIEETLMGVDYPNAIYSLAMGTGKTALIAAMIFYEFVLSWKYPDDPCFAKNALVFAPNLTISRPQRPPRPDFRLTHFYSLLSCHKRRDHWEGQLPVAANPGPRDSRRQGR